jgi:uncharacterized protein YggE
MVTKFSAMDHVTISGVSWCLTDATKDAIQGTARKHAAAHAISKAVDYAEAFVGAKKEHVKPIWVDESGYYNQSTRPHLHREKGVRSVQANVEELQFEPEDVKMEANVSVKFQVEY